MTKLRTIAQLGALIFTLSPPLSILTGINAVGFCGVGIGITILFIVGCKVKCPYCKSCYFGMKPHDRPNYELIKFLLMHDELTCPNCGKKAKIKMETGK